MGNSIGCLDGICSPCFHYLLCGEGSPMAIHGRGPTFTTILTLSQSVEAKDTYTQGHSERVAFIGKLIAGHIPNLNTETVYSCGLIHDVGKLSIPDSILLKKSKLTEEEYQMMKTHTSLGAKLCKNLNISQEIVLGVLHHHERWDGNGYPHGLI
jgi:putative nucleotidyltransferase with HDIG domain